MRQRKSLTGKRLGHRSQSSSTTNSRLLHTSVNNYSVEVSEVDDNPPIRSPEIVASVRMPTTARGDLVSAMLCSYASHHSGHTLLVLRECERAGLSTGQSCILLHYEIGI